MCENPHAPLLYPAPDLMPTNVLQKLFGVVFGVAGAIPAARGIL